jgi:hypothetical protein
MALHNDNHIMARRSPKIILNAVDDDMRAIQVCEADAVYAVCYKGRPIKVRTYQNIEIDHPGPKYAKSSFPESGHAFNLADKLNKKFTTSDFSVVMMTVGRTLTE